ncbi:MAG TPA: PAS domain S-box protein, partial [Clostridia bacterium]|nr:PAS domain S-box protein [Clostridia bacterium]
WREERLADARFFARARFVAGDVERFLAEPESSAARDSVLEWLKLLKGEDRYSAVIIFDLDFKARLALPDGANEPVAILRESAAQALASKDVVMTDLHQDLTNSMPHIDIIFPVFTDTRRTGTPVGVVLLRLDPRQFLFPLLESWPNSSRTAETLLVRREQGQVLYLNELRHRPGTTLNLRLPADSSSLPAALVLAGQTGVLEGRDYRGLPVVAVGRQIPNTTWAMVCKMDQAEIYGPLRQQLWRGAGLVGLLLLCGALLTGLLWRQRNAQYYRSELALEKERARLADRVNVLMRYANDIILVLNSQGRILEANEWALKCYGYSLGEMQALTVYDLRIPELRHELNHQLERIRTEGSVSFETTHQRKDKTRFSVEVRSQRIRVGNEQLLLSIVRDITRRKADEVEIKRLNRLYAALRGVNQAVVRARSREDLLKTVCRVLVESGGFEMSWIGWVVPGTADVEPVAQWGDKHGYLQQVRISTDEQKPQGRGPVGTAIRQGFGSVCNDAAVADKMEPWREAVRQSGWVSVAAFPIREEGAVRGGLAVYTSQSDFFGPQEQMLVEEVAGDISFGLETLSQERLRRNSEARLRHSEQQLRTLTEAIPQLVWRCNAAGECEYLNRRWREFCGQELEVRHGPWNLMHPEDEPRVSKLWRETVQTGGPYQAEFRLRNAAGAYRWHLAQALALHDESGQVTQWFGTCTDITDLVAAREALARNREQLEGLVQERTAQLVEANVNLQSFAHSAAHDLRSPLRGLNSFASIALQDYGPRLDESGRFLLDKIVELARQMGELLEDLLEYSKMSQAELTLTKLSLAAAAEEALALLDGDIRARNASLSLGP